VPPFCVYRTLYMLFISFLGLQVQISRDVFAKLGPCLGFYFLGMMYRLRRALCILIYIIKAPQNSPHGRKPKPSKGFKLLLSNLSDAVLSSTPTL